MGESPFRERAHVLLCPRCGEVLERVTDGLSACTRCEGAWLANAAIERAFVTPYWPGGASAWWRRALVCPACACEGGAGAMTPMIVGELVIDRCIAHGIWLDHGELGRLLGAPAANELEAFQALLKQGGELPPEIIAYHERRDAELARRRREIEAYRAEFVAAQARAAAEQAAAERRRSEEVRAEERKRLVELRAAAERDVTADEKHLVELRDQVRGAESKLADSRTRLVEIEHRIAALDRTPLT
jgi:Zn-finger nucleic acid-binding protein